MITLIKSWVINEDNRQALRETWASVKTIEQVKSKKINKVITIIKFIKTIV